MSLRAIAKQSSQDNSPIKIATSPTAPRNDGEEPVQYTKGYSEFYKLKFKVTPDVLIPRPETELLVDEVLNTLRAKREVPADSSSHYRSNNNPITILDIGTGAGAIAIAIAKNLSVHSQGGQTNVRIIATEVSPKALNVAKQNAKFHRVEDKIEFIESDLLEVFAQTTNVIAGEPQQSQTRLLRHDVPRNDEAVIIVTNLPYIPSARIPYLDASVKDFEPHIALDGGEDGFGLYRKLFQQIIEKDLHPSLILGEIDYTHGELATNEAYKYFPQAIIEVKTDLTHKQRILYIKS